MNHPLARALRGAGLTTLDVATNLRVDPKTVDRWIAGRMPYPRHRDALAAMTGWAVVDLWPDMPRRSAPVDRVDEIRLVYAHRSAVSPDAWLRLFAQAEQEIGVLAYSALFLAEDVAVSAVLRDKAAAGVRVRIVLGDPDGSRVADRGCEEQVGDGMSARIRAALIGFRPVITAGAELRLHDTVLYNTLFRADDELLVNAHIYGHRAAHAPVLHWQRRSSEGAAGTYLESFERVWAGARSPVAGAGKELGQGNPTARTSR